MVQNIKGTPANPLSLDDTGIESFEDPHANASEDKMEVPEGEIHDVAKRRAQITKADLAEFGISGNCNRCREYARGDWPRYQASNHTELCRSRIYKKMDERERKKLPPPEPVAAPEHNLEPPETPVADQESEVPALVIDDDPNIEPDFDFLDAYGAEDATDAESMNQFGIDVDMLMALGVSPSDACNLVNKSLRQSSRATFIEAYGRGGLSDEAMVNPLNVEGLDALDFSCPRPDGSVWDFSKADDWQKAHK